MTRRRTAAALLAGLLVCAPAAGAAQDGAVFGDWLHECVTLGPGETACALTQTIVVGETGRVLAKFSLAPAAAGGARLLAMLPLGIDIPGGVHGAIDEGGTFALSLETCIAAGCLADLALDAARLAALGAGTDLHIVFRPHPSLETIAFTGSLRGLAEGAAAIGLR